MNQAQKTIPELRKFAAIMATILGLFACYFWYRERELLFQIAASLSGFFVITGIFFPRVLGPVERGWLAFGEALGHIVTPVILTVAYIVIITPFGALVRILGKDLLEVRLDKGSTTYWKEVEPDGPSTRPFLPY